MSSHERAFGGPPPGSGGMEWGAKCGLMAGVVGVGWSVGQLSNTCLGLIGGFTAFRAVKPYVGAMSELSADKRLCRDEREALIGTPIDDIEDVFGIDESQAGSVFRLAKLLCSTSNRVSKEEVTTAFFAAFDAYWEERLSSLQDAADQAPVLGLAGSLLGIVAALAALGSSAADNQALFDAMSTMALTTLLGGSAYVLISGLARDAANQVARHRSDLMFVAKMLSRGDEDTPGGTPAGGDSLNPFDLFSAGRAA
ncbi:MotA/TolQ/ExbB proton channel family protein [Crateriforma conspicua]|uniref:MotA/TolQ/ExbB proton channel domain-containing protein n=1 Tax=Crateriforma conspicua TaxID=2527996 RepID=A0A5C6FDR1_9PLAN|nr:MotA/TolQ/ExbB proton channel family protein [Crateriforma conspicua]TWU59590.1 hypothetical protein V7x_55000 [Crateriforma conspicua]